MLRHFSVRHDRANDSTYHRQANCAVSRADSIGGLAFTRCMHLHGSHELSQAELEAALEAGGRLVYYEYCISLLVITLRRPTGIHLLRAHELGLWRGLPFTLVSVLLGWWGIPWGIIYTPLTIITNLSGGRDVTAEIRATLQSSAPIPEGTSG